MTELNPHIIKVLIGTVSQKLKMSNKEILDRITNSDKYYNLSLKKGLDDFYVFLDKIIVAEQELYSEMESYGKNNLAYPKNNNYIFNYCQISQDGNCFYCIYKKLKIFPS